jgi:hypothetical protein
MSEVIIEKASPTDLAFAAARELGHGVYPIFDRAKWLEWRKNDVTASAAGALFGAHEYTTYYELWALKSGLINEDADETPPMRRGRLLEPVALEMLREERPSWTIERGVAYFRDPGHRIGATPDAIAIDPERPGFGIIQFKSVEAGIFARKWRDEDGEVAPPLWIAIQAIIEAAQTGASWAVVVPMVISYGITLPVLDVPLHPGILTSAREKSLAFWQQVESKIAPDPDYGRDGELIAKLNSRCDGSTIDLSTDNRILAIAEEDATLAENIKQLDSRRKTIRAEALAKIGAAEIATVNGDVIATARTVSKKGYEVKPSSYRNLQFKRSA